MPQITIKLGDNVVQNYTFDKGILNIGRSRDNDIVLDNLAVSRNHTRLRLIDGKYILTDLNSANGTYVNGVRVTKTEVMDEDVISIGKHKLIFQLDQIDEEEEIGDAFTADRTVIVENSAEGILTVTKGKNRGEKFKLTKYETTIGRAAENDIVLNDWFVSKVHAKIIKQGATYILKDLGSWKGSFSNDKMLKEPANLKENDELRFGSTKMVFTLLDENKQLQIEGRRPEELGYDENASSMPQFVPTGESTPAEAEPEPTPASAPTPTHHPAAEAHDHEEEDEGPSRMADFGMAAGDDGAEDDFNFEDLPEPVTDRRPSSPVIPPAPTEPERVAPPTGSSDQTAFIPGGMVSSPPSMTPIAADRIADGNEPTTAFNWNAGTGIPGMPASPSNAEPKAAVPPASSPMMEGVSWEDFAPAPAAAGGNGSQPGSGESPAPASSATPAPAPAAAAPSPAAAVNGGGSAASGGDDPQHLVEVWEKALQNKSPIVRKQAAKMLKKLTGKDYEIPQ